MGKMMDLKLQYNEAEKYYDLVFKNGGIAIEEGLDTSIIVDIDTDARAEEIPIPYQKGNMFFPYGSRIWAIIQNAVFDDNTILEIERELDNVLQDYINDGIWASHTITVEKLNIRSIVITITTYTNVGNVLNKYNVAMKKTGRN